MNGAFHYNRTRNWAIREAGFSEAAAELVAQSDVWVDREHRWTFWSDLTGAAARWHLDWDFGWSLLDEALATGDLEQLGRGLHVIQDFYAHHNLDLIPGRATPLYWGFPRRRWYGRCRAIHGMFPTRGQIMRRIRPGRLREWLLARVHDDVWERQTPTNRKRLHDTTVGVLRDFAQAWPEAVA
ncbi:MAG: hypothetical protein FWC54_06550 [Actinomycetia bacterium]|nr:hypothetical protein [Actinomycetes bacterium]